MKQWLLLPAILIAETTTAQNVGIGTSTPQTRLHIISGTDEVLRLDGISPFLSLYSGGVYKGYVWKGPASIELGSALGSDLPLTFAPNGVPRMHVGTNGNVGIGTSTSRSPLSFPAATGPKITFYDDGNVSGANYGIGVQGGLLQLYAYTSNDNIAFGYGSSASFTERLRIINTGESGMDLNGRISLKNGTSPLDINYGPGIWLYKADNTGPLGFMGTQNNQNIGFYGGPAGWGFTYDAVNSRVGIGNPTPNAPLSFPASLGKKITLYPGGTGDAGFGVSGNRLEIYSDNPNADVAIGYDAAGVFNERFAVKPGGALALSGNTGAAGQILQSNGTNPATWVNKPYVAWYTQSGFLDLNGANLIVNVPNINGQTLVLGQPSYISYQFTIPLYGNNGAFGASSAGIVNIQFLDGGSNVISSASSQFNVANLISAQVIVTGAGDMPAGTFTIVARVGRVPGAGNTSSNAGNISGIPIQPGQLLVQVFPK